MELNPNCNHALQRTEELLIQSSFLDIIMYKKLMEIQKSKSFFVQIIFNEDHKIIY